MPATLAEKIMAGTPEDKEIAYQVRCLQSWMNRVRSAASAIGMKPAQYIRMAVTERMNRDGTPMESGKPPKKPRPRD